MFPLSLILEYINNNQRTQTAKKIIINLNYDSQNIHGYIDLILLQIKLGL
jgi:hypothetical protein